MSRKSCEYQSLRNFANRQDKCGFGCNNNLTTRDNPLYFCLNTGVDVMFDAAPMGYRYHPKCRECELYMTQYCAQKWDGYCDHYLTLNPKIKYLVEERQAIPNQGFSVQSFNPMNPFSPTLAVPQVRGRQIILNQGPPANNNCCRPRNSQSEF
jgi:hypothetical protein